MSATYPLQLAKSKAQVLQDEIAVLQAREDQLKAELEDVQWVRTELWIHLIDAQLEECDVILAEIDALDAEIEELLRDPSSELSQYGTREKDLFVKKGGKWIQVTDKTDPSLPRFTRTPKIKKDGKPAKNRYDYHPVKQASPQEEVTQHRAKPADTAQAILEVLRDHDTPTVLNLVAQGMTTQEREAMLEALALAC